LKIIVFEQQAMALRAPSTTRQERRYDEIVGVINLLHRQLGKVREIEVGTALLSRVQTSTLRMIAAAADDEGKVARKAVAQHLANWYDMSNSGVSALLQGLARPPLALIAQSESPNSGREKRVTLTARGHEAIAIMKTQERLYLEQALGDLPDSVVDGTAGLFRHLLSHQGAGPERSIGASSEGLGGEHPDRQASHQNNNFAPRLLPTFLETLLIECAGAHNDDLPAFLPTPPAARATPRRRLRTRG
jgi:DNA-binding MarR family transcriptional regulator